MSFVPEVTVTVNLSPTVFSFSSPQTPSTSVALTLNISKTIFFAGTQSGIDGVITRDATTGIISSISANARNNVDNNLLQTSLTNASSTSWLNGPINGNVLSISMEFDTFGTRSLVFDIGNAINLQGSNSASMGTWISHIMWHALQVKRPSNVPQFTNLSSIVADINTQLASSITTAMSKAAVQTLLIQKIIEANGPVFPDSGGIIQYSSSWTDLDIDLIMTQLTMNCAYYGSVKKLTLTNIPIKIRLV